MRRNVSNPTVDQYGMETHPSYGCVVVNRVQSTGTTLFQSDLKHQHYIVLRVHQAKRQRKLHRDWVHPDKGIVEVAMSMAQWAELVSSFGVGEGTPVTIQGRDGAMVDAAPFAPPLAVTAAEVADKARTAIAEVQAAFDAVEAKPTKEAIRTLKAAIGNLPSNMRFAAESLTEHTEHVVAKAKADVEAFVVNAAGALGLDPGLDASRLLALNPADGG